MSFRLLETNHNALLSKRVITFKLLTHGDEMAIGNDMETYHRLNAKNDIDIESTTRYRYMITSIDGDSDTKAIKKFVIDEFILPDLRAFRAKLREITPDIDLKTDFKCEACDYADRITIPIGIEFFWPADKL